MSQLEQQMDEDRALRDAAKLVLMADVEHTKQALSGKAIAGRVGGRVGDGAKDVFEIAKGHVGDNRGLAAILLAALIVWFARDPLLAALGLGLSSDADEGDTATGDDETAMDEIASAALSDQDLNDENSSPNGSSPDELANDMVSNND